MRLIKSQPQVWGLGIFIGKTLLEKNFAKIDFSNSKTSGGAKVTIRWANKNLFNI